MKAIKLERGRDGVYRPKKKGEITVGRVGRAIFKTLLAFALFGSFGNGN